MGTVYGLSLATSDGNGYVQSETLALTLPGLYRIAGDHPVPRYGLRERARRGRPAHRRSALTAGIRQGRSIADEAAIGRRDDPVSPARRLIAFEAGGPSGDGMILEAVVDAYCANCGQRNRVDTTRLLRPETTG